MSESGQYYEIDISEERNRADAAEAQLAEVLSKSEIAEEQLEAERDHWCKRYWDLWNGVPNIEAAAVEGGEKMTAFTTGPYPALPPRWRRELRILRREGLWKWWRGLRALRRFHRSVEGMERGDGGHDA